MYFVIVSSYEFECMQILLIGWIDLYSMGEEIDQNSGQESRKPGISLLNPRAYFYFSDKYRGFVLSSSGKYPVKNGCKTNSTLS